MKIGNKRGFTLIEVVVVAGIVAILAGVLVPMIFNQVDESRKARALADCKTIANAIMIFRKDTGAWPNRTALNTIGVNLLTSSGGTPIPDADLATYGFDPTGATTFEDHLRTDATAIYPQWKGPYLAAPVGADPWGNAYICNVKDFDTVATPPNPQPKVWVISAGPMGKLATYSTQDNPNGENIGVIVK